MNKTKFVEELVKKTGFDKDKCEKINNVLENNFIIGRNNKEKIKTGFIEKLSFDEKEADELYNTSMEIIAKALGNKITHPFSK